MIQSDELNLFKEKKCIEESFRDSLKEMRKISSFLKDFIKIHKEMGRVYEKKDNTSESENKNEKNEPIKNTNSFLFSNINNIYESFNVFMKSSQNLISSLENDLVKPLDDFIQNQLNFYNKDLNQIKKINNNHQAIKSILDNSRNNYYKSSSISDKINPNEVDNSIIRGDLNVKRDVLIKKKMIARSDEFIYKYETAKYNKKIPGFNEEYDLLLDNIINIENTKINFIQSLLNKYKNYLVNYVQFINKFISDIDKYNTKEIGEKETNDLSSMFNKFKEDFKDENNDLRIPKHHFISYQHYYETIKDKKDNNLETMKKVVINPSLQMKESECNEFIKETVNILLSENDIDQENMAKIFELLNVARYEVGKKILNCLYEKRGMSTLVFLNLHNLEHLSNILGYITLHESSIFNEKFDLNFKIIFIAERIYYLKKNNNDKVYLNALLSKNKYYRTKQFWRDILELKLANKLTDHIKRFKSLKIKEKSKGGIFSRIGNAIGFRDNNKCNLLEKTRIITLLEDYDSLDGNQMELINKFSVEEMQSIIKENIPSFANFNFPSEQSLDLIAQLTQEYRIDKEMINYYVTYFNVSSYSIRKLVPNEKGNTINIYNQFKTLTGINKYLKLFKNIVPFLTFSDYNNLLLCSKLFHKKLSKVIYKHILKQKDLSMNIRLSIWHNLLGISALKKKYNYKEVLSNANDEKVKHEIELDVIRTTVGEVDNPKETREQITNVLYAVSQLNGTIKYCQGMNFVVQLLYELYGEEEAFYIFLAFFINTEYYLIFAKDLEELKILFYVFRRVISLLEPEIGNYFNSNGVDVNFFVPPWFITLFTSSHQNFKGEKDNSQILIRILDNFIVSGLKSIMEVGCVALHFYENVLMSKKYEDMMQFLINDMLRSDFFSKKNKDYIEYFFTNKISKKLVKNIEEEFHQEQKLKQKK
jgi:hypothetical protein